MLRLLTLLALAATLALATATDGAGGEGGTNRARLLARKRVHNKFLVEGQDIVVQYFIYNIGTAPALNVQLTDSGFGSESFDIAGGQLQVKFDRIPPNANVSHTIVVRPKLPGFYNFTAAEVSYLPSEDSVDIQIGYTSEPGEGSIIGQKEYDRKFSPHVFDWVIFALLLIPVLVVPFLMWRQINSKYAMAPKTSKGGKKTN